MLRCFLFLLLSACACAQLANSPPVPLWLAAPAGGTTFTQTVKHEGKLLKAVLLTAGDAAVEIVLDGRSIGTLKAAPTATGTDLTHQLGDGKVHHLGLRVAGQAKTAALLELNGDLAAVRWIATDATWQNARVAGSTAADPATNPFDLKKTFDAYNSWQLARPGTQNEATDPASLTVLPGFKVERVRSAQAGEDSWVAMAFDPEARITLGKEKQGLLRLTLSADGAQKMEVIDDELLECRGLLYAHGSLFANANVSKTLYRLTDQDDDGVFEERQVLVRTGGGNGHGRNHIKLGPEGDIYVAHGNNVLLPENLDPASPLKNYASDQLIPNPWDSSMFDGNVELPAGHILRVKPDGSQVSLIAGGLRNPLDLAFNRADDLFTFDADMERDVGTPWYMPTRVLHVVPGADFGWRRGTGRFPAWYADTLPSVIDIGLSSPTGIFFGYGAVFPQKYRDALFLLDWSYGRILAVHLKQHGASYTGTQETFIAGRPLNVTDGCIGPDGALWFITGGRGTQSGLYRVVSLRNEPELIHPEVNAPLDAAAGVRAMLEDWEPAVPGLPEFEARPAFDYAWQHLRNADPYARQAARQWVQHTPVEQWRERALNEKDAVRAIAAMLELARAGTAADLNPMMRKVLALDWPKLPVEEQLRMLRVIAVAVARWGAPGKAEQARLLELCTQHYPAPPADPHQAELRAGLNRELCRLLVYLKSPTVIEQTMPLLQAAATSADLLFYPFMLRYLKDGWTLAQRRVVFEALDQAEKRHGASTFFKAISDTRSELAAALKPEEALKLAAVIQCAKPAALSPHALPGHSFKNWTLADLAPLLAKMDAKARSREGGRDALIRAQCVFCHRVSHDATLPAGVFGPDLVQVSARFNRRDLLDHILNPSKFIDEKFRYVTVKTSDGKTHTGSLESEDDERVVLKPNPLAPETNEIAKAMIRERRMSEISPMPAGLLNTLKAEQILDLLAWFERMR